MLSEYEKYINVFGEIINKITNKNIIISNREKVLYSNKEELLNKNIGSILKKNILNRKEINGLFNIELISNMQNTANYYSKNIIIDSDSTGMILLFSSNEVISEEDKKIVEIISKIFNIIM